MNRNNALLMAAMHLHQAEKNLEAGQEMVIRANEEHAWPRLEATMRDIRRYKETVLLLLREEA